LWDNRVLGEVPVGGGPVAQLPCVEVTALDDDVPLVAAVVPVVPVVAVVAVVADVAGVVVALVLALVDDVDAAVDFVVFFVVAFVATAAVFVAVDVVAERAPTAIAIMRPPDATTLTRPLSRRARRAG
jgi:hypothetical protein